MQNKLTKSVAWSYPSSPNADRFNFPQGCFTLELTDPAGIIPPQPIKGFATEPEAMAAAHTLPHEWDRLFLKYSHPELACTSQGDEEERAKVRKEPLTKALEYWQDYGGVYDGTGNVTSDADSGL